MRLNLLLLNKCNPSKLPRKYSYNKLNLIQSFINVTIARNKEDTELSIAENVAIVFIDLIIIVFGLGTVLERRTITCFIISF